jgi:hypothetical protein
VGARTGLDAEVNRKIPCLCRESNPDRPGRSLVATQTELPRVDINSSTGGYFKQKDEEQYLL